MVKLLKILLIEVLLLLLIVISLELLFKDYSTNIDQLFLKMKINSGSTTLLLTGNSHIGVLGEMCIFDSDKSLNLAIGGQDIFHQYLIIRKAVQVMPKLKTVVAGIDYDLLGYDFIISDQMYIDRQYYEYTDTLYENSILNRLTAMSSFFRSNRDISYLFLEKKKAKTYENFIPLITGKITDEDCKKRALEHTRIKFDKKLIPSNISILKSMLSICKKNDVCLILLVTPKRNCYYQNSFQPNIKLVKKCLGDFVKLNRSKMIDLYENDIFSDDDFVDSDHLNSKGCLKLTTFMSSNINNPEKILK